MCLLVAIATTATASPTASESNICQWTQSEHAPQNGYNVSVSVRAQSRSRICLCSAVPQRLCGTLDMYGGRFVTVRLLQCAELGLRQQLLN